MTHDPATAVSWKIHPAIGFARVGNSQSAFFVGHEGLAEYPSPVGGHRDSGDVAALRLPAIKRQAALFRVYAYDGAGNCLGEATAGAVKAVEWQVTLANTKASGPQIGLDGRRRQRQRNAAHPPQERWRLEITPQPRRVAGPDQRAVFDDGSFMGSPVCLGEIRTDAAGRLLVLGGHGKAATSDATKRIKSATDNDGWYDDVSDGPVTARLTLEDGRVVDATPAWVVVTPPNYTPGMLSIATQFDVLVDRAVGEGLRPRPARLSFRHHIFPILRRIADMQWLDRQALETFGGKSMLETKAGLELLAGVCDESERARQAMFGDISRVCKSAFTETQFEMLRLWSTGAFERDWSTEAVAEDQASDSPDRLDRAALEASAGGALFADPRQIAIAGLFMAGEGFRLDHSKLSPGGITRSMALPWHADVFQRTTPWPSLLCPEDILTEQTLEAVRELDRQIAAHDAADTEQLHVLRERREALWTARQPWARGLATEFPAREESLIKEWQHLGFIAAHAPDGTAFACDGLACRVEIERGRYLGSMAEYFHRMVNFEENMDFAPKALELALQMLGDAKFEAHERLRPFRYTPEAFEERLELIYRDMVDSEMYSPVSWESGEINWDAIVDYDEADEPVWKSRRFHVGQFSDAALRERFRQFAPQNMTDGSWLQNIISAAPMDGIQARLASIWIDEAGGGHVEQNHSNVYAVLLQSQNIYMPPVTSRDFIELDFVRSAFESPVFQLCVGRFPRRFLPEILGMTLYMEWEATPTSTPIANMMTKRRFEPLYYRMHAAIDNIESGHGALSKEAIKLYLEAKLKEGGDAVVQEHWERIWRGYVAWATLGNGADEIVERMLLVDRKQIHIRSSLLLTADILPPFLLALQTGRSSVARYLHENLSAPTQLHLAAWTQDEAPSEVLLTCLRRDLNQCLKAGIYDPKRFAGIELSPGTRRLLKLQPKEGVDLIDLGRCLLEDAFPDGIAHRPGFPDLRQHYTAKMIELLRARSSTAVQSHRRVRWLTEAFKAGPEAVMQALLDHGFVDVENPRASRLFEKTKFDGPMFRVFSDEELETIVDWIGTMRADGRAAVHPKPGEAAPDVGVTVGRASAEPQPALSFGEVRRRTGMGSVH
jgi:L-Lysine epsilon oxidase N-terminal/Iron-containing redox enzyme